MGEQGEADLRKKAGTLSKIPLSLARGKWTCVGASGGNENNENNNLRGDVGQEVAGPRRGFLVEMRPGACRPKRESLEIAGQGTVV